MPDVAARLSAYDLQLRGKAPDPLPAGVGVEQDGPLVRVLYPRGGGFIEYRDLGGLEGGDLDALIARQVRVFSERAEEFEWKLHAHDRPADLADRLLAAGFVPEELETVVIAPVARVAGDVRLPEGVSLREIASHADLKLIAAMEQAIWQDDRGWLVDNLEAEQAADPDALTIVVAEADGAVVCAGWVRFARGTEFATWRESHRRVEARDSNP